MRDISVTNTALETANSTTVQVKQGWGKIAPQALVKNKKILLCCSTYFPPRMRGEAGGEDEHWAGSFALSPLSNPAPLALPPPLMHRRAQLLADNLCYTL